MATLKFKDIKGMGNEEREKKLKELKLELVKSKAGANKAGSSKDPGQVPGIAKSIDGKS